MKFASSSIYREDYLNQKFVHHMSNYWLLEIYVVFVDPLNLSTFEFKNEVLLFLTNS